MRVLQVLNYSSSDGRYGGPQKVAESIARGSHHIGMSSTILSLTDSPPLEPNHQVRLFTARRFFGSHSIPLMFSVKALSWVRANIVDYNVVHLHLSRDFFTNSVGFICWKFSKSYVVQTHGMLQGRRSLLKIFWDLLVIRPILKKAKAIFYLTEDERADLLSKFNLDPLRVLRLENGGKVILGAVGAEKDSRRNVVLYASRLDPRKRPLVFLEMANKASEEFPNLEFQVAGSDFGSLPEVLDTIRTMNNPKIQYVGSLNSTEIQKKLDQSVCVVLPALWDVFPMIMVESACRGVPVISVSGYEISNWFSKNGAAKLCDGSAEDMLRSLRSLLAQLQSFRESTIRFASNNLDENVIAKKLQGYYIAAMSQDEVNDD